MTDSPEAKAWRLITVDSLVIDERRWLVTLHGEPIEMGRIELTLLLKLAEDPERVVPKQELLRDVWGYEFHSSTRTLDSHCCRLRKKLGKEFVRNVWGVGYALVLPRLVPYSAAVAA